jgi:hypothetical protein
MRSATVVEIVEGRDTLIPLGMPARLSAAGRR